MPEPPTRYTSNQLAEHLHVSRRRVNQLVIEYNLGQWHGRDRIFTEHDLDTLAHRIDGRKLRARLEKNR